MRKWVGQRSTFHHVIVQLILVISVYLLRSHCSFMELVLLLLESNVAYHCVAPSSLGKFCNTIFCCLKLTICNWKFYQGPG